jgi:glutamate-5-semialdehyde dehydrogenase
MATTAAGKTGASSSGAGTTVAGATAPGTSSIDPATPATTPDAARPAGVPSVAELCRAAREASRTLAESPTETKNRALEAMASALSEHDREILEANERDIEAGQAAALGDTLLDRLRLDQDRLQGIARAVREIIALPDPVGEVIEGWRLPNGLDVRKLRVPLGVVAVVYEARPNVTIDATALCLKAGNAIVLRGSSVAAHSNAALARIAADAAGAAGLPPASVVLVQGGGRDELAELAKQDETVDLIIPRGGEGLKNALQAVTKVPVIYAAAGNCHVYVDASADLDDAEAIVLNAKVQRPGVCNAAEKLLIHSAVAERFVPRIVSALHAAGVEVRADDRTRALAAEHTERLIEAAHEDWATEYLSMTIAVAVVDSVEQAIERISRYGSAHSEAIVTADTRAARAFQLGVDAACVYVNASTRFTDGGEFGMGAEIGNSTQKLHARGPIGLRELCTYKYLVEGDGHVRL